MSQSTTSPAGGVEPAGSSAMRAEGIVGKTSSAIEALTEGAGYLAAVIVIALMVLTLATVFWRYALRSPLRFSDEAMGYLMSAVVYFGFAWTMSRKGHIRVDLGLRLMPARVAKVSNVVAAIISLVWFIPWSWGCATLYFKFLAERTHGFGGMEGPLYVVGVPMLLGSALMVLQVLVEIRKKWQSPVADVDT